MSFTLTPEQSDIIQLLDGCYLVTAPPGSGKTQVLTQRIIHLLGQSQHHRILALTFTTKAAENMKVRIERESGDEWRRVTASTFHAFCLSVLEHYGHFIGVGADILVYENEGDRLAVLAKGLEDEGFSVDKTQEALKSLRTVLAAISKLKRMLIPSSASPSRDEAGYPLNVAYAAYDRTLRDYGAVDFDDLLGLVYQLFMQEPQVAKHYRRLYRYILVDEAQDTSRAQYEILKLLCGDEHRNVMMVADYDQSIYRFAGASSEYLKRFVTDFGAITKVLTVNFRCAEAIVSAANQLIKRSPVRTANRPEMESATRAPGFVRAVSYRDEDAEAATVVKAIRDLLANGLRPQWLYSGEETTIKPEELAILARNRYALTKIIETLDAENVRYSFVLGEASVFESVEARLAYQGLRMMLNERDQISKENCIALCEMADVVADRVRDQDGLTFVTLLAESLDGTVRQVALALPKMWASATDVGALVQSLMKTLETEARALAAAEDENSLLVQSDTDYLRKRWMFYSREVEPEERSLRGFLGYISLAGRNALERDGIRVLTVHASKGLEFRAVFLVGMNEGTFPDFRSSRDPEALAEEYREAYVACTRAGRCLILTRPRSREMPWGDSKLQTESRFIQAAGLQMKDTSS